jgi:hypothetical protein
MNCCMKTAKPQMKSPTPSSSLDPSSVEHAMRSQPAAAKRLSYRKVGDAAATAGAGARKAAREEERDEEEDDEEISVTLSSTEDPKK